MIVIFENRRTIRAIVKISIDSKNVVVAHERLFSFFLISSLKAPQPFCDEDDDGFGNGFDDQAFYASRFVPIYGLSLLSKRLLPIKTCRVGHGKEVPFLYLPKKQGVKARPKPGPPSICTL